MFPGTTTKLSESTVASAATIDAKSDIVFVTGTTAIDTIVPHFGGGFSGMAIFIALDDDITVTTTGNVVTDVEFSQIVGLAMYYSKARGLWYPQQT